jgi:hypothetical protein
MSNQTAQGSAAGVACLTVIAVFLLRFLFTILAWNLGVVGAVQAFGGHVANIGLGTAIGIVLVLGSLRTVFVGGSLAQSINAANTKGA